MTSLIESVSRQIYSVAIPIKKPKSATRLTKKAFMAARFADFL